MNEAVIQDIESNLNILKERGIRAKVHSFFCFWWPFKSLESHISYLETLLLAKRKEKEIMDNWGK